ncbi:MAG: DUF4382 domain-containing protein [Chloroflexota bacterium]|nr:DUF4382 domain-containing protein [Chloroflexota bacterium]
MRKRILVPVITVLLVAGIALAGCSGESGSNGGGAEATGTLQFHANGEDFVREGFVSKDGWSIAFDHVYINLEGITAYQTDPPYDPHSTGTIDSDIEVGLDGSHTIDLAAGDADADPILVGTADNVETGHYNAISWEMTKAASGSAAGYSLVMIGTAEKDGQAIDFTVSIEEEYGYSCGEYVGDERKGIVEDGGTADVEMTFHFDHIFGDAAVALDDELNTGAPGFDPFAAIAEEGVIDDDMSSLQTKLAADDYQILADTLFTLGHVGEGHCHCE